MKHLQHVLKSLSRLLPIRQCVGMWSDNRSFVWLIAVNARTGLRAFGP